MKIQILLFLRGLDFRYENFFRIRLPLAVPHVREEGEKAYLHNASAHGALHPVYEEPLVLLFEEGVIEVGLHLVLEA